MSTVVQWLDISSLRPHIDNPRLIMREDVIQSIADQIKQRGEYDPAHSLLVRPWVDGYQIVMGHHRYEAVKRAGLKTVPCWVREMSDEEAHMQLATGNTQDSMSPLEWGIHALKHVELSKSRWDSAIGLREYAKVLGRSVSGVTECRNAARVIEFLSEQHTVRISEQYAVRIETLMDKAYHLNEISKCPQSIWLQLVDMLIDQQWTVAETKSQLRDLQSLEIPQKWQDIFLPLDEVASLIVNGRHTSASVDSIIMLVESVEESVSSAKNAHDDAIDRFHAWLRDTHSTNPFDSKAIKDYQTSYLDSIRSTAHVSNNSGNNEWYTPVEFIDAARSVMGGIDLDPASSDLANDIVGAEEYFTVGDNGLLQDWGGRVWMNPPYSSDLIAEFSNKLVYHVKNGDIDQAIVLVNNATETVWFSTLISVASAVCFPSSRVNFWGPDGQKGAPLQGQAVIYIGKNSVAFRDKFNSFGWSASI